MLGGQRRAVHRVHEERARIAELVERGGLVEAVGGLEGERTCVRRDAELVEERRERKPGPARGADQVAADRIRDALERDRLRDRRARVELGERELARQQAIEIEEAAAVHELP